VTGGSIPSFLRQRKNPVAGMGARKDAMTQKALVWQAADVVDARKKDF
jgi:hypothetical protein